MKCSLVPKSCRGLIKVLSQWERREVLALNFAYANRKPLLLGARNVDSDKYFSGVGRYETSVDVTSGRERTILDFGDGTPLPEVELRNGMRTFYDAPIRESAVVYINGQKAGSLWAPPYQLDITKYIKAGRNDIRIDVGNTAVNYMAGHRLPDYRLLNLRFGERFQPQEMDKIRSEPSGIIGRVRLLQQP